MKELLISSLIALLSALIGYFIRYRLDKIKDITSQVTEERRDHYQKFINIVVDVLKSTSQNREVKNTKVMNELYDFYKRYIVYASPQVINAFGDYFQFLFHQSDDTSIDSKINTREHIKLLARIITRMRRDLGLSNRKLGKYGEKIFRATLRDLDDFFK